MPQKHFIPSSPVYVKLTEFFFKCVKSGVYYTIAKVLIKKINEFPNIYIEEIAFLANTTPASVTKFCKKIGYASFKEMRTDIFPYAELPQFSSYNGELTSQSIMDNMLQEEEQLTRKIYEQIDLDQCYRIAQRMAPSSEVAVLCNTYSFAAANTLRELLSYRGITVFEMNRRSDPMVVQEMLQEVDCCFIICLTGQWLVENPEIVKTIEQADTHTFLLTSQQNDYLATIFDEVISLEVFQFLFSSNYYSQKIIHTILKVIANNLSLF
ncbi:DNA-binding MurR/RpiR family transcriptional regulator [Enterococcus rotai]|uniref:RpiR family transcriptional regulator n=1 Tax=Enterococcus rotai TaxID=118060 RepID=A0A0U2WX14_9ENTE|nr:MurR/RpiR family transcriptional regulator [Enterococcus rotai]ALS36570.1 hypothetical protein ATZ35_05160 [Enterococcus rotai]